MTIGGTRLYDLSGSTRTYGAHPCLCSLQNSVTFRWMDRPAVSQSHESRLECLTLSSDVSVNVDLGKLQQ